MEASGKLKITINSFSFKRGVPYDPTGNGGGFVMDCRGILNPGRYERYAYLTGKDQEVIDFFHKNTVIDSFLKSAKELVEVNIKNYLERGFENLTISFGCTGGQHRSVYCAEWMAKQIREKYDVIVELNHLELPQIKGL